MQIRPDLQTSAPLLSRLIEYSKVFHNYNFNVWPHLKNNEDFNLVYQLPCQQRGPLEDIYADGRGLASFMATHLIAFNHAEVFPTLKSYVDSFNGGWVDQIEILKNNSDQAKNIAAGLTAQPWALRGMITLFDEQIALLLPIKQTIEALKYTDIYKWESGVQLNTIHTTEYPKILACIHSIGKMFERLPNAYNGKDEESLRDHILVTLGAAIIGSSTGETFNKRGKTDILVRDTVGGNEFVGECKFWRGKEVYLDTISQLLGYLSWRDTKTAVILFVPNLGFGEVISKIKQYTAEHPNFIRMASESDESWQNYEFRMNEDSSRVVTVAVMAYHMPK